MIVAGARQPILIATKPVDFRCGHQALALMVQAELKLDPHSGVTVIFRSKRGDRLKILVWDGIGMVLTYKVLEEGSFALLKVQDGVIRRAYFALFCWAFWSGSDREVHVSALRSQPVPGSASRGEEGVCGDAVRTIGRTGGAPARAGGGGREGRLHHRIEGPDRAAGRPGSGLPAHEVRAEIGKAGPGAVGAGAGRPGDRHRRDAGADRRARRKDCGQRTRFRGTQASGAPQGPGSAREPASGRAGGRARQHHLPLWLRGHGPDRRGRGGSGNGPGDRFPDDGASGWITSRPAIR